MGTTVQGMVWAVLSVGAFLASRRNKDLRLLVVGLSVLTLGVLAVRSVH